MSDSELQESGYVKEYSEPGFWAKLMAFARTAGREVVGRALQLFYAAQSPNTPAWAKTTIYGALGYFISMIDAVPDITPIVGFTDDLGVLAAAIAAVATHITPEVKAKAQAKLNEWFPDFNESGD